MEEQTETLSTVAITTVSEAATGIPSLAPKSPLKTEVILQDSPDNETSGRSDGAASPPPNCSICLGKLVNKSFTDSCLHQFCFSCLSQWSKIKTECPLCKQTFKSIIHNVRSEEDYDQYHVPRQFAALPPPPMAATLDVNFDLVGVNLGVGVRRFSYRTTMQPNRRYGVILNPDQVARREQIPALTSLVSRGELRHRRTNPVEYRRNVYRFGMWATSLADIFGNFRECSAEYYRREPNQLNRIIPWLNRELQVLLNNNAPHIAYVMRIIVESLTRYDLRSPEFRDIVRPYFGIHTEHFVHELLNYARTNFDLIGYDQYVTYILPTHGLSNEYVPRVTSPSSSSSSTSNDSDVQVVDETPDLNPLNAGMPGVGPHLVTMPGPSTVAQAFQERAMSPRIVLTISSSSSEVSDDECEVVGYVKPRHERTPEIIDLLSSDADTTHVTNFVDSEYGDHHSNGLQSAPRQCGNYDASNDRTVLLDSSGAPTFEEIYEPSTSTNRKRSTLRSSNRVIPKRRVPDTTTSDSDNFDSDLDYIPYGNAKSKNTSKTSATTLKSQKTCKRRVSGSKRVRRCVDPMMSSSSDSDDRCDRRAYKSVSISPESEKRGRSSSRSDSSPDGRDERQKTESKSKSAQSKIRNVIKVRKDLVKKEEWNSDDCVDSDVSTRSDSSPERASRRVDKSGARRHRLIRDPDSECIAKRREDSNDPVLDKKQTESKSKVEYPSTDSDRNSLNNRSGSQSSLRSRKAHVVKKKSKHKDKRKDKRSRRSENKCFVPIAVSDSFQADDSNPGVSTASVTSSTRSEALVPPKYSNSTKSPSSRERRRTHKKHKDSKKSRKRSKSSSKSRSKKKKRRTTSLTSSESGRDQPPEHS
ncbi:E3 ubiquitin-protein ligase Topors-like isoform X1 [Athalia rosae]|uniref:E3 ubiquitin-protein ligase Topors-like isoform X1 n=1 Tax=Athalia rosae TaxID=37344 RepID=UPI00203427D6|nr:E3 ubiquitin-protein ligase Topors-like isoform X1 [Athalia rosae]XP_012263366.2 E3 ubiquitin-protein ligase Topors-like isoform X1 [Athalia rosae]